MAKGDPVECKTCLNAGVSGRMIKFQKLEGQFHPDGKQKFKPVEVDGSQHNHTMPGVQQSTPPPAKQGQLSQQTREDPELYKQLTNILQKLINLEKKFDDAEKARKSNIPAAMQFNPVKRYLVAGKIVTGDEIVPIREEKPMTGEEAEKREAEIYPPEDLGDGDEEIIEDNDGEEVVKE